MDAFTKAEMDQIQAITKGRGIIMNTRLCVIGVDKQAPRGRFVLVAADGDLSLVDNTLVVFPAADMPHPSAAKPSGLILPGKLPIDPRRLPGGNGKG